MNDLLSLFPDDTVALVMKILVVFLIGLYIVFVFVVFNHIRALKRVIIINHSSGSPLIQTLSLIYLLASLFLFVAALVIL